MIDKNPDITIKLRDLVSLLLGDSHSEQFPPGYRHVAELIEIKAKGTHICHVQWTDQWCPELQEPVLWVYARWCESVERWERARKRAEEERKAKFIFDANVRMVTDYCKKYFCMDKNWAATTAYGLVKNNRFNGLKVIGVDNLYTTIEELP